jgi:hypothetical protein
MGKTHETAHKKVMFYIPSSLHQNLKDHSHFYGVSMSEYVTLLIQKGMYADKKQSDYDRFFTWANAFRKVLQTRDLPVMTSNKKRQEYEEATAYYLGLKILKPLKKWDREMKREFIKLFQFKRQDLEGRIEQLQAKAINFNMWQRHFGSTWTVIK